MLNMACTLFRPHARGGACRSDAQCGEGAWHRQRSRWAGRGPARGSGTVEYFAARGARLCIRREPLRLGGLRAALRRQLKTSHCSVIWFLTDELPGPITSLCKFFGSMPAPVAASRSVSARSPAPPRDRGCKPSASRSLPRRIRPSRIPVIWSSLIRAGSRPARHAPQFDDWKIRRHLLNFTFDPRLRPRAPRPPGQRRSLRDAARSFPGNRRRPR